MKEIQISKLSLQQRLAKLSPALYKISNLFQKRRLYLRDLVMFILFPQSRKKPPTLER